MATKKQKVSNVPNLRFQGFDDEWVEKRLGDVLEFKAGYAFSSNEMLRERSTYQLIKMSNVYQSELRLDRNPSFWNVVDAKQKEFILKKGDTVLTLTGTVGKRDFGYSVHIKEDDKYLLNQRLVLLREKELESINEFIHQLVSNEKFLDDFFGAAKGGTGNQTNVGIEDVKKISFSFPSVPEQKRIADFFTLIDERIATQNKIIEQLETLMQCLREKLLTQKLRFKDETGNDFPDLEVQRLGNVFSFKTTNSYSREKLNYEEGDVKNIHYGDIHTQYRTLFNAEKETTPYINLEVNTDKIAQDNLCKEGDLILADASEDLKDVGKSIEIVYLNRQKILAGLHTIHARPLDNIFFIGFCGYLFKSEKIRLQIQKEAQGSKVLSISAIRLSNVVLGIPCLIEQTQIVNFLSDIDEKIETERNILKRHEFQKQYFLRNLFI